MLFRSWLGVYTGLHVAFSGILGMVLFLAVAFGFMYAIERTKDSAAGVGVLLAFTFFMGLMMSGLISAVLGFRNGPQLIITAFGGTAGVFFVMASLATVIKRDLSGMGQWLFIGVIGLMVASIINAFVGSTVGMMVISTLAIIIFSAFMLFDIRRVVDGGETNYISATLAIYWDILTCSKACWPCWASLGASATEHSPHPECTKTGVLTPVFFVSVRRAQIRPCSRHAPCAGTC